MANFCRFCGSNIEDGNLCDCPKAVEERQAAQQLPSQDEVISSESTNAQSDQPVDAQPETASEAVIKEVEDIKTEANSQTPPQSPGSAEVHIPEPVGKIFSQFIEFIKSFFKNPISVSDIPEQIPHSTSFLLLLSQVIAFMLFWLVLLRRALQIPINAKLTFSLPLLTSIVSLFILYLVLFLVGIAANKGSIKPVAVLSAVAVGSFPITTAYLVLTIFILIFGGMVGVSLWVSFLLISISSIFSLLLVERGLRSVIESDLARTIVLAIAAGIQLIISFHLLYKGIASFLLTDVFGFLSLFS